MLTIRLQRVGKANQPVFRIVIAEKHRSAKKKVLEILGHYNPVTKEFGLKDKERLGYWIKNNVEISPTLRNLFLDKGLVSGSKVQAWRPKKKADLSAEASAKVEVPAKAGNQPAPAAAKEEAPAEEPKVDEKK